MFHSFDKFLNLPSGQVFENYVNYKDVSFDQNKGEEKTF